MVLILVVLMRSAVHRFILLPLAVMLASVSFIEITSDVIAYQIKIQKKSACRLVYLVRYVLDTYFLLENHMEMSMTNL